MAQLDVNPMIMALNRSPDHFAFTNGSLHHIPSGHKFQFDGAGRVRIEAQCNCTYLEVCREQEAALYRSFNEWQSNYWRPVEINRQFAAHFHLPLWRRILVAVTSSLHRTLLANAQTNHGEKAMHVPAE